MSKEKKIFTCFAGRRKNMEILLRYTDELRRLGLLDEMHVWDYTRDVRDAMWLRSQFQEKKVLKSSKEKFVDADLSIGPDEEINMAFMSAGGARVLLVERDDTVRADISLGLQNDSYSLMRFKNSELQVCGKPLCSSSKWRNLIIKVEREGKIEVKVAGEKVFDGGAYIAPKFPLRLYIYPQANESVSYWRVPRQSKAERGYISLFKPKDRSSWSDYYSHYTNQEYPEHIIIKSDDDIVFIDVESFGRYTEQRRKDAESLLLFPSIVNNGVCAFYQSREGFIGESLGEFPYDPIYGRLWGDGRLCGRLHEFFVGASQSWLEKARADDRTFPIGLGDRTSINFFAILSKDLYAYQMVTAGDDEHDLTVRIPNILKRRNAVSMGTTVSHLSFYRQRETGLDEPSTLGMYERLAERVEFLKPSEQQRFRRLSSPFLKP